VRAHRDPSPWTPPRAISVQREGLRATLQYRAQPGSTNLAQYACDLPPPACGTAWADLGVFSFAGATGTVVDTTIGRPGSASIASCGWRQRIAPAVKPSTPRAPVLGDCLTR
jgi:hypothetical protein